MLSGECKWMQLSYRPALKVSSPEESVAFITLDEASGFGFFFGLRSSPSQ